MTHELTFSELGYYLACFEAALSYVLSATPESLQPEGALELAPVGPCLARGDSSQQGSCRAIPKPSSSSKREEQEAREQLAIFLHEERNLNDLVSSLTF